MSSLNQVQIIGRLGKDPEIRYTQGGEAVATISVATSESWKDKTTQEKMEKTEWHRVVMFGKVAEIAGQYLKKGSLAFFQGKLETRKWTDKDGVERYTTEIRAREMTMLGSKSDGGDGGGQQRAPAPAPAQRQAAAPRPAAKSATGFDDMDDDIPF